MLEIEYPKTLPPFEEEDSSLYVLNGGALPDF